MSLTAMALLWTGSQIPVYLYGMPFRLVTHTVLTARLQVPSRRISTKTLVERTGGFGLCWATFSRSPVSALSLAPCQT